MFGRILVNDRTNVLFPVPFGPDISTPPILGAIRASFRAIYTSFKPSSKENGITSLFFFYYFSAHFPNYFSSLLSII